MRDIDTITIEEARGLWNAVMTKAVRPFRGVAYKYKKTDTLPDRIVLMSGVDRMGVFFGDNPKVWADCDLDRIELDQEKVTEYLAGIGLKYQPQ